MSSIKIRKLFSNTTWYILVTIISVITVFPLIWTVFTSFKPESEIMTNTVSLFTSDPTLDNYRQVFQMSNFGVALGNSFVMATVGVLTNLFFGSLAGYAFAKLNFKGRKAIFSIFLASMMIPFIVTMIPSFLVLKHIPLVGGNNILGQGGFGFINTLWAVILPGAAGAFAIFFMKQFFETLPEEMGESARIDGCGEFGIFARIYMPLAKPALATLGIMTFQSGWNSFMWPLIVLNDPNKMTVQVALASFKYSHTTNYGPLMAGTVLATLPVLALFIFAQKYFIRGLTIGSDR